jgi:hypothetical protein
MLKMAKSKSKLKPEDFVVIKLSKDHKKAIDNFDCENEDLNEFIQEDALLQQERNLSVTYLYFLKKNMSHLTGFITLSADMVNLKKIRKDLRERFLEKNIKYHPLPALKICRMGVDINLQGSGIGTIMFFFSLGTIIEINKKIGCRFLYVDAKHESINFYKKLGFQFYKKDKEDKRITTPFYIDCLEYEKIVKHK